MWGKNILGSSTGDLLLENKVVIKKMFEEIPLMFPIHSEDEQIMKTNKEKLVNPTVMDHYKWRSKESALSSTKKLSPLQNQHRKKFMFSIFPRPGRVNFLIDNNDHATFEITPQHLH